MLDRARSVKKHSDPRGLQTAPETSPGPRPPELRSTARRTFPDHPAQGTDRLPDAFEENGGGEKGAPDADVRKDLPRARETPGCTFPRVVTFLGPEFPRSVATPGPRPRVQGKEGRRQGSRGSPDELTFKEVDPRAGWQAGQQRGEHDARGALLPQLLPVEAALVQHDHRRHAAAALLQQPSARRLVGQHVARRHRADPGPPQHHRVEVDVERAAHARRGEGQVGPAVEHHAARLGLLPEHLAKLAPVERRDLHAAATQRPKAGVDERSTPRGACGLAKIEPGQREGPPTLFFTPRDLRTKPRHSLPQKAGDSTGSAAFYVNECASCDVTAHIRPNMGVSPPLCVGHASWAGRAGTRLHSRSGMEGGCLSQSEKEEVAGACS